MEANSDVGGAHREAPSHAAQHRVDRVALGVLSLHVFLFLQLHRFMPHTALCNTAGTLGFLIDSVYLCLEDVPSLYFSFKHDFTDISVSYQWRLCSSQLAESKNEQSSLLSWLSIQWVCDTPAWSPRQPFHRAHKSSPSSSPQL